MDTWQTHYSLAVVSTIPKADVLERASRCWLPSEPCGGPWHAAHLAGEKIHTWEWVCACLEGFLRERARGGDEWLGWIALNKQTHHDGGFFFSRGSLEYSMQRCNSENKCMGKNEHVNKWYTIYTRDKTATTYIVNFFLNINIVQSVNALTGPDRDKARTLAVSSCPLKKCWTAVGRLTALFLGSGSSSFF